MNSEINNTERIKIKKHISINNNHIFTQNLENTISKLQELQKFYNKENMFLEYDISED
jgi:hypothetical protein